MIISPIFYMGNKKKLIKKGLIELFPKNINKFIEPFGGSAIISMNTQANIYIISDIDNNLVDLYKLFKYNLANVRCAPVLFIFSFLYLDIYSSNIPFFAVK